MIAGAVTHVIVSSVILAAAMAVAAWVRPLTARTRHAVLVAGLAALALPAPLLANFLAKNDIVVVQKIHGVTGFTPSTAVADGLKPVATFGQIAAVVWVAVAALLLLRWWMVTRRLVQSAIRAATPPPPRTVRALEAARRRLGLHRSVDLIASATCEAPAVVRVLRPMIILPADGCEALDDSELESLLCHECAHVARRDNLLGVAEAIACSLFWFNPLVWLAHRRIAAAREAACDERVADAALPAGTYVGALAKICRSLIAPRVPAVSCMASAHLKERIQHLMSYDTLRKSAFSHRFTAAASLAAVLLTVAAAGVVTANPITVNDGDYRVDYSMHRTEAGLLDIRMRVVDRKKGDVVGEPTVAAKPGERTSVNLARDNREWTVFVDPRSDGSGELTLVVRVDGREVQSTVTKFAAPGPSPRPQYSGAPISLNLSKADLRDVLNTFAQITGITFDVAPNVQGTVNMNIVKMPWDQALDQILRENGYAWRVNGNRIEVFKP